MDFVNKIRASPMQHHLQGLKKSLKTAADGARVQIGKGLESVVAMKALREYQLGEQVASGGLNRAWKIFAATPKHTHEGAPTTVSVWLLDKKALLLDSRLSKSAQDTLLESYRNDASQLARLRHPGVIRVLEVLEENRTQMAIVTEPVVASLYNFLHKLEWGPSAPHELKELQLSVVEIKHGVLQLAETLAFLGEVGIVHGALSPESVYMVDGAWKIAGFGFAIHPHTPANPNKTVFEYQELDAKPEELSLLPPLGYVAPEMVTLGGGTVGPAADVFSLAAMCYELATRKALLPTCNNILRYRNLLDQLPGVPLSEVDPALLLEMRAMLSASPSTRPTAAAFAASSYFANDTQLRTLRGLEELLQYDNLQKAAFLRELARGWDHFDRRVLRYKVLPPLLRELRNNAVQALVLPLVLAIASKQDPKDFVETTLPQLAPLFESMQGEALVVLLEHVPAIAQRLPCATADATFLPLLCRSCDSSDVRVQEAGVKSVSKVSGHLGYLGLKKQLLPKIHRLVMSTNSASVRVHGLVCYGHLVPKLHNEEVEAILECITKVLVVDKSAPTIMCALGVGDVVSKHFGPAITASKVIPMLSPMLVANSLAPQQLGTFLNLTREMISRIEAKQMVALTEKTKLEESVLEAGLCLPNAEPASGSELNNTHCQFSTSTQNASAGPFSSSGYQVTTSGYQPRIPGLGHSSATNVVSSPDPFAAPTSKSMNTASQRFEESSSTSIAQDPFAGMPPLRTDFWDANHVETATTSASKDDVNNITKSIVDQLSNALTSSADLENLFVASPTSVSALTASSEWSWPNASQQDGTMQRVGTPPMPPSQTVAGQTDVFGGMHLGSAQPYNEVYNQQPNGSLL